MTAEEHARVISDFTSPGTNMARLLTVKPPDRMLPMGPGGLECGRASIREGQSHGAESPTKSLDSNPKTLHQHVY